MKRKIISICLLFTLLLSLIGCSSVLSNWAGYQGTMEGYEYYYEDGRERDWEEDILNLAENFVRSHPYLRNEETDGYCIDGDLVQRNLYDEEKYHIFLNGINELIKEIPNLSDQEIRFKLQKSIASLGDGHSHYNVEVEVVFPVSFMNFYEKDGVHIYVNGIVEEHKGHIFSELVAINGIPVKEIAEKMKSYLSLENDYGWWAELTSNEGGNRLSQRDMLAELGVISWEDTVAKYTFCNKEGKEESVELKAVTQDELKDLEVEKRTLYETYAFMYKNQGEKNFWYEYMPDGKTIYVRIARFKELGKESFLDTSRALSVELYESEQEYKVIVDLRGNNGGSYLDGYDVSFINLLKLEQVKDVYVLIDSDAFSRALITTYDIKEQVEGAQIVGTPTSEGSQGIGYRGYAKYEMPNHGDTYYIGNCPFYMEIEEEFDTIMPDILIYPTLEDYKNGVDTILEAVLEM